VTVATIDATKARMAPTCTAARRWPRTCDVWKASRAVMPTKTGGEDDGRTIRQTNRQDDVVHRDQHEKQPVAVGGPRGLADHPSTRGRPSRAVRNVGSACHAPHTWPRDRWWHLRGFVRRSNSPHCSIGCGRLLRRRSAPDHHRPRSRHTTPTTAPRMIEESGRPSLAPRTPHNAVRADSVEVVDGTWTIELPRHDILHLISSSAQDFPDS
jgi:hypothetical protein